MAFRPTGHSTGEIMEGGDAALSGAGRATESGEAASDHWFMAMLECTFSHVAADRLLGISTWGARMGMHVLSWAMGILPYLRQTAGWPMRTLGGMAWQCKA